LLIKGWNNLFGGYWDLTFNFEEIKERKLCQDLGYNSIMFRMWDIILLYSGFGI
jgi:hypothetical protein